MKYLHVQHRILCTKYGDFILKSRISKAVVSKSQNSCYILKNPIRSSLRNDYLNTDHNVLGRGQTLFEVVGQGLYWLDESGVIGLEFDAW